MRSYCVSLGFIQWDDYFVEAETEEEALKKGRELYEEGTEADSMGELSRAPDMDEASEEDFVICDKCHENVDPNLAIVEESNGNIYCLDCFSKLKEAGNEG